jgi:hypothetical protein
MGTSRAARSRDDMWAVSEGSSVPRACLHAAGGGVTNSLAQRLMRVRIRAGMELALTLRQDAVPRAWQEKRGPQGPYSLIMTHSYLV